MGIPSLETNDDPAGGSGGRGPQPRHGAMAALDRLSVPARPERSQCIAIAGRGRPSVARRGRAARKARQPPRSRASTLPSGRRRTVGRVVAAWNEPAARSPRCRSRARDDGCTNRAAERAAYFAAMLSSTGQWYRVKPPLQVTIEGSWQPLVSARPGLRPGRSRVRPRRRTGRARQGHARVGPPGGPRGSPGRRGSSAR